MRINLNSFSYLFSHLSEFTDFSLINLFKGFVTPSPFNFLSSSNLPNTIDQIIVMDSKGNQLQNGDSVIVIKN